MSNEIVLQAIVKSLSLTEHSIADCISAKHRNKTFSHYPLIDFVPASAFPRESLKAIIAWGEAMDSLRHLAFLKTFRRTNK